MSDKLLKKDIVSSDMTFDEYGRYEVSEVVDMDMLETIGGGVTVNPVKPGTDIEVNLFCPGKAVNLYCPGPSPTPTPTPPAPTPNPNPPKEPPKTGEDGDEEG